jgi:uroporphyrinogen III methyltransferase / synthase
LKGKVYIVGAGPGDPSLLTIRAAELLRTADVVVYDRLVDPEVLKIARDGSRKIYAGKRTGEHWVQEKINALMLSEARKGRVVLRLKGGDPMIFGRGGEEAEFLRRNRVDFEIVPGVTSALAAPAMAGIPLTHRMLSSSILIVTGHEAKTSRKRSVNWRLTAGAADTLVILMGARNIPEVAAELVSGGLNARTPVAVIEWAATRRQRTRLFTLAQLATGAGEEIVPPSVIVVGRVASLAKKLDWFRVDGRPTLQRSPRPRRARADHRGTRSR